eukprot:SAG31_NODE_6358_length_2045_cov_1.487667_2_plen_354_part_00
MVYHESEPLIAEARPAHGRTRVALALVFGASALLAVATMGAHNMAQTIKEPMGGAVEHPDDMPMGGAVEHPDDMPNGEGYGPPNGEEHGPPNGEGYGPPNGEEHGPPHGEGYGPPNGEEHGPPHGEGYGPPHGEGYGPPHGEGYGEHIDNGTMPIHNGTMPHESGSGDHHHETHAPGDECTVETANWACLTKEACTAIEGTRWITDTWDGGSWTGCEAACSAAHFYTCKTEAECTGIAGTYHKEDWGGWCDPPCSPMNKWMCHSTEECAQAGGFWEAEWESCACVPPMAQCQDDYDMDASLPRPWGDFVSCADEAAHCHEHPDTLMLHCKLSCGECHPHPPMGALHGPGSLGR